MKESRSCDPELYSRVKDAVSMQQAVEYCGLHVSNGKCLCPFHKDTHPSMKIYPNGKGYYCFVCGSGGDQIRFVAAYYGTSNYEACLLYTSLKDCPEEVYADKKVVKEIGKVEGRVISWYI